MKNRLFKGVPIKRDGFTLIELMLVILIIGLVSAIAIPTYMGFQSRSRQAEAKANLGGIFICEQASYTEHETYSEDLKAVGFALAGEAKHYGFSVSNAFSSVSSGVWIGHYGKNGPPSGSTFFVKREPYANNTSFRAIAVGNVDKDATLDSWSIDNRGTLANEDNDIEN